MAPEDLLAVLRKQPFTPFRLHLTDGQQFEVRHPELLLAGRRTAILGIPAPDDTELLFQRTVWIDLLHIATVELLSTPATPGSNGS